MIWTLVEVKEMGMMTRSKSDNIFKTKTHEVYNLQKGKRGDLWFLLTFLIPLSIIPVKISYAGSDHSYFLINWIFMQVDMANNFHITFFYPFYPIFAFGQDIFYNSIVFLQILCLIAIFWSFQNFSIKRKLLHVRLNKYNFHLTYVPEINFNDVFMKNAFTLFIILQFVKYYFTLTLPGQTFYVMAMITQAYLIVLAVIFRIKQYYDRKNGTFVESGVIGLIAVVIVFLQVIRFFFSDLYISEFFYNSIGKSWNTKGAKISNSLFASIKLFPFPFLDNILNMIGFTNVDYPFTFSLRLISLSVGIIIPLIWAYYEYKAFPPAFSRYVTKFFRYIIILLFVFISVFPLIWMVLVSFNDNIVLKQGLPIWPFNSALKPTFIAWDAFGHFVINPGHSSGEAILTTILTLLTLFIGIISIYKRKSFSAFFEKLLGENYRERIIEISWFLIITLQLIVIIVSRTMLEDIYKPVRYNIPESNSIRVFLEFLNQTLVIDIGNIIIFNILVPLFLIFIVLVILGLLVTRGRDWLFFSKMEIISKVFNFISIIIISIISLGIVVTNILVLFTSDLRLSQGTSFSDIFWFDLLWVILLLFSMYTFLPKRRLGLIGTFEGFYLEDGFAFTLTIIFWALAIYFGILADNAYNWMYLQSNTHIYFPVGDWFFITMSLCVSVSLISIVLASLSGYAISRYQFYGRGLIGGMILSTQIFPGVILVLPTLIIFKIVGLTGTLFGLGVAYSVISLPFVTYLLKGFFDSIPKDLEEQAMIDGCTRMQAYRKIVLPLVLPGIASTFIFSFLSMYTEYLFALIIYGGTTANYTISLAMLKVFQADLTQRGVYYNEMAVFAVLVSLPVLFLFTYLQRYLLKGLVSGGMKG